MIVLGGYTSKSPTLLFDENLPSPLVDLVVDANTEPPRGTKPQVTDRSWVLLFTESTRAPQIARGVHVRYRRGWLLITFYKVAKFPDRSEHGSGLRAGSAPSPARSSATAATPSVWALRGSRHWPAETAPARAAGAAPPKGRQCWGLAKGGAWPRRRANGRRGTGRWRLSVPWPQPCARATPRRRGPRCAARSGRAAHLEEERSCRVSALLCWTMPCG